MKKNTEVQVYNPPSPGPHSILVMGGPGPVEAEGLSTAYTGWQGHQEGPTVRAHTHLLSPL